MHVYLREEQVTLRMETVEAPEAVPDGSDLVPMAFYVNENQQPSFRALLPPDTVDVLRDALGAPVTLGLLAEEPEGNEDEIHAVVGLAVPISENELPMIEDDEGGDDAEPWRQSIGPTDAWKGEAWKGEESFEEDPESPRTALLAFAPLVRVKRRFPADFGEELADLLESALTGSTKPAMEARVDRFLDEL